MSKRPKNPLLSLCHHRMRAESPHFYRVQRTNVFEHPIHSQSLVCYKLNLNHPKQHGFDPMLKFRNYFRRNPCGLIDQVVDERTENWLDSKLLGQIVKTYYNIEVGCPRFIQSNQKPLISSEQFSNKVSLDWMICKLIGLHWNSWIPWIPGIHFRLKCK